MKDKLEATDDWEVIQRDQLLHKLIGKIERICIGFDNHKQEMFNLVQALKTLFLYMQTDGETVEEYGRNFKSFWDMVEAFGGSPGVHKGLVAGILKELGCMSGTSATPTETKYAEAEACKSVKAALLISGADRKRYGRLKDQLANNYLLGMDQYPDTYDKAMRILGNYQVTRPSGGTGRPSGTDASGIAFIQQGGQGGRGGRCIGRGRGADEETQARQEPTQVAEIPRLHQDQAGERAPESIKRGTPTATTAEHSITGHMNAPI